MVRYPARRCELRRSEAPTDAFNTAVRPRRRAATRHARPRRRIAPILAIRRTATPRADAVRAGAGGGLCLANPGAALSQAPAGGAAQDLPAVVVTEEARPKRPATKRTTPATAAANRGGARANQAAQETASAGAPTPAQAALDRKMQGFDQSRDHLLPKFGASSYTIDRAAIEAMPQGDNTPIDKLVLQFPGVNYDSAVSNPNFHVRGEYANVQTRINGLVLPEGVSGLGPVIDTNFIGSLSLLTGTLPAQYGLRTAGVLDITSRAFPRRAATSASMAAATATITPSFDYGGSVGNTQYFFTGRGNWNSLGIENPTSSINAIHDHTDQGKFFAYVSTLLDDSTRLSMISGRLLQQVPDPQQSRTRCRSAISARHLQFVDAQRKRDRPVLLTISSRCRPRATPSTPSSRCSRATPRCISFPTSSATSCSTTSPRMSPATARCMAPSSTPPTT